VSLGRLSGSHAVTLSLASLDLSAATLTDAMTLFYRVERSSIGGQTLFGTGGIASQRFTLSTELGPLNVQGGASFSSKAFTFGNHVLSGRFEGVTLTVAGLTSNVGSVQTPVYGFGTTVRVSGFVPNLGRLAFVFGIGATPFGQVKPGFCFEGACISWADLGFCGGTASVDVAFDELGPSAEYLTWTLPLPFCHFRSCVELFYEGLLDFQGFHAGVAGDWGDAALSGDWSFDADRHFVSGSSQVSGPAWGGTLVGQATFDETGLLGVTASWTYSEDGLSLTLCLTSCHWGRFDRVRYAEPLRRPPPGPHVLRGPLPRTGRPRLRREHDGIRSDLGDLLARLLALRQDENHRRGSQRADTPVTFGQRHIPGATRRAKPLSQASRPAGSPWKTVACRGAEGNRATCLRPPEERLEACDRDSALS
jgi:hypothetical protein